MRRARCETQITARTLASPAIAGRMSSRWCQENHFGYMMELHDIDGLVQYGSEGNPGEPASSTPPGASSTANCYQLV